MTTKPFSWTSMSHDQAVAVLARCLDCGEWYVRGPCPYCVPPNIHEVRPRPENYVLATPCGGVVLDVGTGHVQAHGRSCLLSKRESQLLAVLLEQYPRRLTREEIELRLWHGLASSGAANTLVHQLRKKLPGLLRNDGDGTRSLLTVHAGDGSDG